MVVVLFVRLVCDVSNAYCSNANNGRFCHKSQCDFEFTERGNQSMAPKNQWKWPCRGAPAEQMEAIFVWKFCLHLTCDWLGRFLNQCRNENATKCVL